MFKRAFWVDAGERAVRAGAAAVLAGLGAQQVGALELEHLQAALLLFPGGALVSVLLSVAAGRVGEPTSAAFTTPVRGTARRRDAGGPSGGPPGVPVERIWSPTE